MKNENIQNQNDQSQSVANQPNLLKQLSRIVPPTEKMVHHEKIFKNSESARYFRINSPGHYRIGLSEEVLGIICHILLFTPIIILGSIFSLWYGNRYVIYFINYPLAGLFFSISLMHEVKEVVTQNILIKIINLLPKDQVRRKDVDWQKAIRVKPLKTLR